MQIPHRSYKDIYINASTTMRLRMGSKRARSRSHLMDKCKEYEATVRDYVAMANDNSQLQPSTRYSKFGPQLTQKAEVHRQRQKKQKQLCSREHRPQNKPCKRCGFECHRWILPSPQVNMWILQDSWTL